MIILIHNFFPCQLPRLNAWALPPLALVDWVKQGQAELFHAFSLKEVSPIKPDLAILLFKANQYLMSYGAGNLSTATHFFFFPTQFKHQGQKQGYLVSLCNFDDGLFIAGVHSRESLATDSVHKLIVDETLKQRQKIFFLINFQKGLLWSFSNWKSTFLIKSARSVLMCPMAYWKCT